MGPTINRRALTAWVRVCTQVSRCGIRGGVALGQVFLRVIRFSPLSIISSMLHTHLHLQVAPTRMTEQNKYESAWKPCCSSTQSSNSTLSYQSLGHLIKSSPFITPGSSLPSSQEVPTVPHTE